MKFLKKHYVATLSVLSLLLVGGLFGTTNVQADGFNLRSIIQTVEYTTNQLPIAKKILEVNNHPQPEIATTTTTESTTTTTTATEPETTTTVAEEPAVTYDGIQFGSDGLLVETASSLAQSVINDLLSIPGHSNGAGYHANGLDAKIDQPSTAEAIHVIHRIEGAGFGQTGDGYAGIDTPESHRNFVSKQINNRFGGSVHQLLRKWGTYSYGGY